MIRCPIILLPTPQYTLTIPDTLWNPPIPSGNPSEPSYTVSRHSDTIEWCFTPPWYSSFSQIPSYLWFPIIPLLYSLTNPNTCLHPLMSSDTPWSPPSPWNIIWYPLLTHHSPSISSELSVIIIVTIKSSYSLWNPPPPLSNPDTLLYPIAPHAPNTPSYLF